jgi:hypothetical protein
MILDWAHLKIIEAKNPHHLQQSEKGYQNIFLAKLNIESQHIIKSASISLDQKIRKPTTHTLLESMPLRLHSRERYIME